jgi:signal transduction histidine kinase
MAKWKVSARAGDGPNHVSAILIPFLIVTAGVAVLAWRSYVLSERMERGVNTLAMQYAGYAADISARRIDGAVGAELFRASEEWQGVERRSPSAVELKKWIHDNDWIISALYVPDSDPANAIFAITQSGGTHPTPLTREFYSSSGTVRYTYDPDLLIARVYPKLANQPLVQAPGLSPEAQVGVIKYPSATGAVKSEHGYAFIAPLAAPLSSYAVRGFVETGYGTSGWENARLISILLSAIALLLTALGLYLAMRGLTREADTMKLRGALVANVSHELRTPLSMIRLGAETLKRGANRLPEKQRHEIEDSILREVLHLSHLVENVLDIARIQNNSARALAFTPVYPRDLLTSLVSTYESWVRSRGFEITLHIDDAVEEQSWDRDAVSRAVLNLIDNATKYAGDKNKRIDVVLRQNMQSIIIEVRDHGLGIEADDLTHIFEPYFRAHFSDTQTRRGAGLGLTLVQQIVASHGGSIEVDSKPGLGSTFRLLFPRPQSSQTASPGAARNTNALETLAVQRS